ncbi:ABC transporter permease [Intrasporangium calvum]|uniref:ABC transporter permease n=1 Tax=Intrasporangium calvum TaxID=53358 RepID=A0ABT5GF88_9MICO|nr:ABC transporter permease [Intrasporangium calvum]MDC5696551.1 ABC transporter permease [Intrasporangium calvum]
MNVVALIAATLVTATPLLYATIGEIITERSGILNLGIEGTMYAGAFGGFIVTANTGSPLLGLLAAVVTGMLAGGLMGLLTVTLGVNQHVAGIGTTLLLIGASEFSNRLLFGGGSLTQTAKFALLFTGVPVLEMYLLTMLGLAVVAPLAWWLLRSTGLGLRLRAVGENPEAADAAGISVERTRYVALVIGGALMAVGGAFLTLAVLGTFTLNITNGRGWVAIALVIFARWRIWPAVASALLFAVVDAAQLQLAITPTFAHVPRELMIALPYLAVIIALAVAGRGLRYPGAYLKPYRRT